MLKSIQFLRVWMYLFICKVHAENLHQEFSVGPMNASKGVAILITSAAKETYSATCGFFLKRNMIEAITSTRQSTKPTNANVLIRLASGLEPGIARFPSAANEINKKAQTASIETKSKMSANIDEIICVFRHT
jgi:hypothetical protein